MLVSASCTLQPSAPVVTVHEVRKQARIDSSYEDTEIEGMILAAVAHAEARCRRSFRPQNWLAYYKDVAIGTPETLHRAPIASAVISYRDTATTWAVATANTLIEGDNALWYPPYNITAVQMTDGSPNWKAATVCGGAITTIPAPVKQAILILAAHLYEQRTPVVIGAILTDIPFTIDALLAQYTIPAA